MSGFHSTSVGRARTLLTAVLFLLVGAAQVNAVQLPFTISGGQGIFNPGGNVVFDTTAGTYSIGGVVQAAHGSIRSMSYNGGGLDTMAWDFDSITLGSGRNVTAIGSRPLTLLSLGSVTINGVINVNGSAGGAGSTGVLYGGGGGGGGGGAGGAVAIFTAGNLLQIGTSGRIAANGAPGGSGGVPGTISFSGTGFGGASGVTRLTQNALLGGNGGMGGWGSAGFSGGAGGNGGAGADCGNGGGGGGGGSGDSYPGMTCGTVGGAGGPAYNNATKGADGGTGKYTGGGTGLGGAGGTGAAGWTQYTGGHGGDGGTYNAPMPDSNGDPGSPAFSDANGCWGGGGGGGGGAAGGKNGLPAPGAGGTGGLGHPGMVLTATAFAGGQGGLTWTGPTVDPGWGGYGPPGGGGAVVLGASTGYIYNAGTISTQPGATGAAVGGVYVFVDPAAGFTQGTVLGNLAVDNTGATASQFMFVAGASGGGGGGGGATIVVLPGDADANGTVNGSDLNTVLSNYNQSGMGWSQGDFTGDSTVNGSDLNIVLSNYNQSVPVASAVPEPGTLGMLALGAMGILAFARRRQD